MQNAQVFKKRTLLLVLIMMILALAGWRLSQLSPLEQSIIRKVNVSSRVSLYITQASAGATTDFSFRYYLYDASRSDESFKESLANNLQPFLITSDGNAFKRVQDKAVYLTVKGEIFAFHSSPGIRINDVIYAVPVFLTASPF
ncbi:MULTISPECIES: hypothetical protein [Pantoea]|uniref:Uncharacterized protein n=1 Tax=Candidatus Pantoea gossypiicola TaxID=2608008 RepID=A0AB34CWA3_9GAMM|nr:MULTISPECIES: hypothetical protein [Pantoea]KAA5933008.1 hypothetical protein F3I59_02170 [Pantoea sp. VH_8]KAA5937795.1 hypothetical protein F3I58_02195 [Pantoea sp. VH_4]KAA5988734.1 hypothetical protein F3I49_03835 [Pantoea sp. M_4]KAA6127331.1 hypothetical protein F3I20_05620 [Pantoea gossypiicola]